MTPPRALLHIGKHKTGTTSFQKYLTENSAQFAGDGLLFVPMTLANLIAASLIRNRMPIPPVKALAKAGIEPSVAAARDGLQEFLAGRRFRALILSCEHFSYFRDPSEVEALKDLLKDAAGVDPRDVSVCLMLRDPDSFLRSYKRQIVKTGHGTSEDKASPYYCEADSWLLDDTAIKDLWWSHFNRLDVLQYETGDAVFQLCKAMAIPAPGDPSAYRENKGDSALVSWGRKNLPKPVKNRIVKLARSFRKKAR
ncbi:hypothetical protein [Roseovarius aestuariivivens]|uniref:hypothetical protein n=1 Tax=Roseovarius aestuariivivens TaxID=1888910 RepID=UPI0010807A37|nr:hypothetical protein [Roseovarius aestuariivivens]